MIFTLGAKIRGKASTLTLYILQMKPELVS